ncbi:MAG: hypothetical protein LC720_06065, partial [Actinobacteria bacterium]|nr:hypothetical protein [Actinomycetota bacterium]
MKPALLSSSWSRASVVRAILALVLAAGALWLVPAAGAQAVDPAPQPPPVAGDQGATVSPGSVPTTAVPAPAPAAGGVVQLSDERVTTFWAHSAGLAVIHFIPTVTGRQVGRLRLLTEDGAAEVYIVLRRYVDGAKRTWLRIRVPRRP